MPTADALVSAKKNSERRQVNLMLDGGATVTAISWKAFKNLPEAHGTTANRSINVVGGNINGSMTETIFYLWLSEDKCIGVHAIVIKNLSKGSKAAPDLIQYFPKLKKTDLAADLDNYQKIDIIIGQDIMWRVSHLLSMRSPIQPNLVAALTSWGWTISGSMAKEQDESPDDQGVATEVRIHAVQSDEETFKRLARNLDDFMSLEVMGVAPQQDSKMKAKDKLAMEMFMENLTYDSVKCQYTSRLLFDPQHPPLKSNKGMAIKRFRSLEGKWRRNPDLKRMYVEQMRSTFDRGDAEWIDEHDTELEEEIVVTFYLPHSGVFKESSVTTKLRIVFDGSCKTSTGYSLNDCLLPGPQFEPDLLALLLKFRMHKTALCGDISKMYLAINLHPDDRRYLRFVWREEEDEPLRFAQMTRITFGIADSSFQSTEVVKVHAQKFADQFPEAAKKVQEDRWVDDLITGTKSPAEAIVLMKQIQLFMKKGNFHFRKWMSNDAEVLRQVPLEDRADMDKPINFDDPDDPGKDITALGVKWNPKFDVLSPVSAIQVKEDPPTRTTVASGMAQIFDPLGLASPFTITAKLLHQDVWRDVVLPKHPTSAQRKAAWREPLEQAFKKRWLEWEAQVPALATMSIPRWYMTTNDEKARQLHIFGDASPKAFGAVAYMVTTCQDGTAKSEFVVAKCRVNPASKPETLARLELMAALMAARMMQHFKKSTGIEVPVTLWTDSGITYTWLTKNPYRWREWVSRRVLEIQALTKEHCQWRHLPGVENPADLCTRGISAEDLACSSLWMCGPPWLTEDSSKWPPNVFNEDELIGMNLEEKTKNDKKLEKIKREQEEDNAYLAMALEMDRFADHHILQCSCSPKRKPPCPWKTPQDHLIEKCSNFTSMVRILAYCFRIVKGLDCEWISVSIRPDEFERSLKFWTKTIQKAAFEEEIELIKKKKPITKGRLTKVAPFIDEDGIMRVGGRLQQATDLPYDVKHPYILPHDHVVTRRIIRWIHGKAYHSGPEWTYYHLRQRFWLPKARRTVKAALAGCVTCKRWTAACMPQKISPLPEDRLIQTRPFSRIGVDFAGPYTVKDTLDGRTVERKAWIALFTCFSTRAVMVDCVLDLTTATFLNSLRRLSARFGAPSEIWSDNAKTFKAAANELKALWSPSSFKKMKAQLLEKGIIWHHIAPLSPWQGGVWERLVGLVKAPFKKTFSGRMLTVDDFRTSIAECESYVNSRPLAAVSDDVNDPLPITPAKLLYGYEAGPLPHSDALKKTPQTPAAKWKERLKLRDQFAQLFRNGYILDLIASSKKVTGENEVQLGEIVLIHNEKEPRGNWPLGIVVSAKPGADGIVRTVIVKTQSGLFTRAVQRLVRLNIKSEEILDIDLETHKAEDDES